MVKNLLSPIIITVSDTILSTMDRHWDGRRRYLQILIFEKTFLGLSHWSWKINTEVYHQDICNISKAQMDHVYGAIIVQ